MNWTSTTFPANKQWLSVTYGQSANIPNGLFVAVAIRGTETGNRVMTSPDGITWTLQTSASDNEWTSVTYGQGANIPNGLFVAVASSGTGNRVMTSPDGITWTSQTTNYDSDWNSITYANGLFVAVGFASVMTSPDGITWTTQTSPSVTFWTSVTYGQNANIPNGLFVAVASSTAATSVLMRVMTSPDGITWTTRNAASNNSWLSVTYGQNDNIPNGLFVAVARTGTGNRVMTSPDGITWTSQISPADNDWNSVTYGNGLFVAVASSLPAASSSFSASSFSASSADSLVNRVMTSPDGITWTPINSASNNNNWSSVTYGQNANIPNGLFVAVSYNGTSNRVMTSASTTLQVNNNIKSSTLKEILEGEFILGEFDNGGIPITVTNSIPPIVSESIRLFYNAKDFKERGISVDFLKERGFSSLLLRQLGFYDEL